MRWTVYAARIRRMWRGSKIFIWLPEAKRPAGWPRHAWDAILKWTIYKQIDTLLTQFIWSRTRISSGVFWTRWWSFKFHKRQGNCWVAKWQTASQKRLCPIEFFELWSEIFLLVGQGHSITSEYWSAGLSLYLFDLLALKGGWKGETLTGQKKCPRQ
jgi:hypothetical protein